MQILLSFESQTTLADIMSRDRRSSGHIVSDALKAYWKGMQPKEELAIKRPKLFVEPFSQDPPTLIDVAVIEDLIDRVTKLEDSAHPDNSNAIAALRTRIEEVLGRVRSLESGHMKIGLPPGFTPSQPFPIGGPVQPKKQVDLSPAAAWPNIEKGPILTRGGS